MNQEKLIVPNNGFVMLFTLMLAAVSVGYLQYAQIISEWVTVALSLIIFISFLGFFIVSPNESAVLVFFGKYDGTVKSNGFFWANPFYAKKKISLRARNLNGDKLKVNDGVGNPIEIAMVLVWKVSDTFKAVFEVDDYNAYVRTQSEAAVRSLANKYPYDEFEIEEHQGITLLSGAETVNTELEKALYERLVLAGIEIIEARISHLAYAQEIASAMLQRQQAIAIVSARQKIVEGAVGMVDLALQKLSEGNVVTFDEHSKAAMVSNLMVVLCSDRSATPVINAGTLNH